MKSSYKILITVVLILAVVIPVLAYAQIVPCGTTDPTECGIHELGKLLYDFIKFVIGLALILTALVFAYAGYLYLTAGGDQGKIKRAHDMFLKVLLGAVIALSAFVIVDLFLISLGLEQEYKTLLNTLIVD